MAWLYWGLMGISLIMIVDAIDSGDYSSIGLYLALFICSLLALLITTKHLFQT